MSDNAEKTPLKTFKAKAMENAKKMKENIAKETELMKQDFAKVKESTRNFMDTKFAARLERAATLHPNLVICPNNKSHQILFTKLRDQDTSSENFIRYAKRAMRLVAEEALAEFPSESVEIITPCGPTLGLLGTDPASICAVSIIRSGDALLEAVRDVEPAVRVGKILIQRDESTPEKTAELFYSKLPPAVSEMHILLCDPMLATGGSAKLAIDDLVKKNQVDPSKIVFCNLVCAPEGLAVLADVYPQVKIVTVIVDEKLNKDKYIVPGLGDFGDRFYSTL